MSHDLVAHLRDELQHGRAGTAQFLNQRHDDVRMRAERSRLHRTHARVVGGRRGPDQDLVRTATNQRDVSWGLPRQSKILAFPSRASRSRFARMVESCSRE
jgi:hypothetical protein